MGGNVLSSNVLGPGISAVLTTAGDLLYVNAAGELVRLPIGAATEILTVVGGLPDWEPGTAAILTTNGDLLYRNGAGVVTRLPIGVAGEVLTVVSSLPDWEAPGKVVIPITGWVEDTGWTYASAATFTKTGDFTAIFRKGTKLRYKQGGSYKYAYVTLSALAAGVTTITCTGGSDYSLANAAITDVAYSHIENPEGFPDWFNYTPTFAGWTNPPTGVVSRFCLRDRLCTVVIYMSSGGSLTSNAVTATVTAPILSSATVMRWRSALGATYDDAAFTAAGVADLGPSSATITLYKSTFGAWTASGFKLTDFVFVYEI